MQLKSISNFEIQSFQANSLTILSHHKGVLETSHSVGLSLSIWICCGLLSLIGALCYAELGTAIPKSGGDYSYIREAFGDLPAFLFLWVATLIIMPTGNAIAALTFANYALVPYYRYAGCGDPPEQAVQLIAIILVCFLTFINCYKVTWSAFLMDAFTFAKVFALTIIIGVGFWQVVRGEHIRVWFYRKTLKTLKRLLNATSSVILTRLSNLMRFSSS